MNINEIYNRFHLRREDLVRLQGCDESESIKEWDARIRENQYVLDYLKRHLQQKDSADLCTCKNIEHVQGCEYWGLPNQCYYNR